MTSSLVVLVAGLGSRFGGAKQHQAVGPFGETLFDYTAYDAIQAGFDRLVLVTRPELLPELHDRTAALGNRMELRFALQRLTDLPDDHQVPTERTKPWGTAHALLCAVEHLDGPFAVVNGDDYYGRNAFVLLAEHTKQDDEACAMLGYRLRDTLSEHGGVTRAVCRHDADGFLTDLLEVAGIVTTADGIEGRTLAGDVVSLSGEETISRNAWAFRQHILGPLTVEFERFLARHGTSETDEFLIPEAVQALAARGAARVRVVPVRDAGFGLTHAADLPAVRDAIRGLVTDGVYPSPLWS